MSNQSFCGKCGSQFEDDCDFCTECGASKSPAGRSQAPPAAPSHQWMQDTRPPQAPYQQTSYQASPQSPPPMQPVLVMAGAGYVMPPGYGVAPVEKAGTAQAALVISICMLSLSLVALIPCLGWMNWLNLLALAEIQHIIWWISFARERGPEARRKRLMSLPFFTCAIFISGVRLVIGGGCF